MKSIDVARVQRALRRFARAREWERFHTPKNLVLALAGEVGELCEIFQWLNDRDAALVMRHEERAQAVRDELADIVIYVLRLADILHVDLRRAIDEKMDANAKKYPVELTRGSAAKYTEYAHAARTPHRTTRKPRRSR